MLHFLKQPPYRLFWCGLIIFWIKTCKQCNYYILYSLIYLNINDSLSHNECSDLKLESTLAKTGPSRPWAPCNRDCLAVFSVFQPSHTMACTYTSRIKLTEFVCIHYKYSKLVSTEIMGFIVLIMQSTLLYSSSD